MRRTLAQAERSDVHRFPSLLSLSDRSLHRCITEHCTHLDQTWGGGEGGGGGDELECYTPKYQKGFKSENLLLIYLQILKLYLIRDQMYRILDFKTIPDYRN